MQRERAKYKDLLSNAQYDLTNTRNIIEKETELKMKQDVGYQQYMEETSRLTTLLAEKDMKIREIKRQHFQSQSKIKYLEEENESLSQRIDRLCKERSKLSRELRQNLISPADLLDTPSTSTANFDGLRKLNSSNNLTRSISIDPLDKTFKSNSFSMSYWNELNASSCWDINYNTGILLSKHGKGEKDLTASFKSSCDVFNNQKVSASHILHRKDANRSIDLNSFLATPKSYR